MFISIYTRGTDIKTSPAEAEQAKKLADKEDRS